MRHGLAEAWVMDVIFIAKAGWCPDHRLKQAIFSIIHNKKARRWPTF
jgi:hypothetical protein